MFSITEADDDDEWPAVEDTDFGPPWHLVGAASGSDARVHTLSPELQQLKAQLVDAKLDQPADSVAAHATRAGEEWDAAHAADAGAGGLSAGNAAETASTEDAGSDARAAGEGVDAADAADAGAEGVSALNAADEAAATEGFKLQNYCNWGAGGCVVRERPCLCSRACI